MARREAVLSALEAALKVAEVTKNGQTTTRPTDLKVHRFIARQADKRHLPDITVAVLGENPSELATDLVDRELVVALRCRVLVPEGISSDEALDELTVWAELAALADPQLSGAAADMSPPSLDQMTAREFADGWAEATLRLPITYQTKWGDPRQGP